MRISIAMATYNGAKYLQEQLKSFQYQTHLPDELVICDDGSTDVTLQILEDFRRQAPFVVHVFRNEFNLGYAKNFERAISLCRGDIILLSDQDDIWFSKKIEKVILEFKSSPKPILVVHDAEIILASGGKTNLTVAKQLKSQGLDSDHLLLGCCMAFRKELKPIIIPIPHHIHGHDGWINALANTLSRRKFIPNILQSYRRHLENTSTQRFTSTKRVGPLHALKDQLSLESLKNPPTDASIKRLEKINLLLDRLKSKEQIIIENILPKSELILKINQLEEIKRNFGRRLFLQRLRPRKRIIPCIRFYISGGYKMHEGYLSFIRDITAKSPRP